MKSKELYDYLSELSSELNYVPSGFLQDDIYINLMIYAYQEDRNHNKSIDAGDSKMVGYFQYHVNKKEYNQPFQLSW